MLSYKNNFKRFNSVASRIVLNSNSQVLPVLSVLIPTYGRTKLIAETISSALSQSFKLSYEIIVVDNGSSNEDVAVLTDLIEGFNAKNISLYSNEKNIGMVGNWNRCIELSQASWLIILHDDDLMHPNLIEQLWENRSGEALVSSSTFVFTSAFDHPRSSAVQRAGGKFHQISYEGTLPTRRLNAIDAIIDVPFTASGSLLHKDTCLSLGGYDVDRWPHFDHLFSARYLIEAGGILVKNKLLYYRLHENASSHSVNYIKFHRAKYTVRKAISAEVIKSCLCRYIVLIIVKRLKWLDFCAAVKRYSNDSYGRDLRFDRFFSKFSSPSVFKRLVYKFERLVYPTILLTVSEFDTFFKKL